MKYEWYEITINIGLRTWEVGKLFWVLWASKNMSDQPAPNPSKLWSKCIKSAIDRCLKSCFPWTEISSRHFNLIYLAQIDLVSFHLELMYQRWRQRLKCSEPLHKFRALGRRNVDHDRCLVGSDCSHRLCKCNMAAPSIPKPPWVFGIIFYLNTAPY